VQKCGIRLPGGVRYSRALRGAATTSAPQRDVREKRAQSNFAARASGAISSY
jgi:hypothetical protein